MNNTNAEAKNAELTKELETMKDAYLNLLKHYQQMADEMRELIRGHGKTGCGTGNNLEKPGKSI